VFLVSPKERVPMRVLLAGDHTLFREGLRALLERVPEVTIVGETGDGREALDLIDRVEPDVAILDTSMQGLSGLEVASRVRRGSPSTRVVVLSMHDGEAYVEEALRASVAGYLLKEFAPTELAQALGAVARGEAHASAAIANHVVGGSPHGAHGDVEQVAALTPRQREILRLVAAGKANKDIAAELGLSVKTVEGHRAQLMERLGIHDVAGLVRLAVRAGLVPADA